MPSFLIYHEYRNKHKKNKGKRVVATASLSFLLLFIRSIRSK